ncbi:hypothetical protein Angca_007631, partial [Angiostrongylus cantonensis]
MGSRPSPEEVALQGLSTAVGHILDNIGFSAASGDSLNALTDIMRRFMVEVWSRSKLLAEHAGRTEISPDDIDLTFRKLKFSPREMRDYLTQVGNIGQPKPICEFPVSGTNIRPLFDPQASGRELEGRAEHIPPYYPAVHPTWTAEGADYLAVMKPSTSLEKKGGPADFPDFSNCDAKSLGLLRRGHEEPSFLDTSKDHSSATGIRSSANLSSLKLQQSGTQELLASTGSYRKKPKGSGNYKDQHGKYSPSSSPSPLSVHLLKQTDQSTSRSESPSSRLTVTLPRKPEQKHLKVTAAKGKKSGVTKMGSSNSSPMPVLEYQSVVLLSSQTSPVPICLLRKDAGLGEPGAHLLRPIEQLEAPLSLKSFLLAHIGEEVSNDSKQEKKEKREKQKAKRKKQQEGELGKEGEEQQQHVAEGYQQGRGVQQSSEERAQLQLLELNRDVATPPMREELPEALTPKTTEIHDPSPSAVDVRYDNDSDTIPFFDDSVAPEGSTMCGSAETMFSMATGVDNSSSPHRKKKKKKEREDVYSKSPQRKEKKRDKEHKKKKKKKEHDRNHKRGNGEYEYYRNLSTKQRRISVHEPKFTLKIRIGDQTSTTETVTEPSPQPEPVKIKFKNFPVDELKEVGQKVVPPLKLGSLASHAEMDEPHAEPRRKFYTKAELKAPHPLSNSFDTQWREERKRKRKDEEERKREKEERRRLEKEERRRIEQEREKELE